METQSLQFQLSKLLASFKGRRMTSRSTGFNPEPVISVWKQTRGREEEQFPLGLFLCIAFSTSIYRLGQSVVILCFQCNAVIILLIPGLVGKIHLFKCCGLWAVCGHGMFPVDCRAHPCSVWIRAYTTSGETPSLISTDWGSSSPVRVRMHK